MTAVGGGPLAGAIDAATLRRAFTGFFERRGHVVVPSASLIPHDPTVLFTIAGMVPFKPYFLGEEAAPYPRATSVQKCFRTLDIDIVGLTHRHCTFFEMLGNFSFGDYFKAEAIPFAWEFVTGELGIDGERLWVTVHETDDDAEEIWADSVGVPRGRIQRMGEDNFWKMGDTGPCGPCSELYFDKGPDYGPDGGPAFGGSERFVEIWNLVFMQFNREADGSTHPLPRPSIDTGAGLERILPVLQGVDSIYATDVFAPVLDVVQSLTGRRYGADERDDVGLRILADHARAMTVLAADGVLPSNEGRGYVLRRIIRRAVRRARTFGLERAVAAELVDAVVPVLSGAYPELAASRERIVDVAEREESGFLRTLQAGSSILEAELARRPALLSGDVAFKLHDTYGFPIELTKEIATEAGIGVDDAAFEVAMACQREQARAGAKSRRVSASERGYREILESHGVTEFVGDLPGRYSVPTTVVAVLEREDGGTEIVLDRTPFYAEGGGQVGDTGHLELAGGRTEIVDTVPGVPGITVHRAGAGPVPAVGDEVTAVIDGARREAIRRNHTGTHLLHAALRTVLGDHVHQQGSLVTDDRLRFDFAHHGAVAPEELEAITAMVNEDVLADAAVTVDVMSRAEADALGALAFFGDKYGAHVRVVRAGPHSTELCGGTHVGALGQIGLVTVVAESSIGSNTRRIEALTGMASLRRLHDREAIVSHAAEVLRTEPDQVVATLERLVERQRTTDKELTRLRQADAERLAGELAAQAADGAVVARVDGIAPDALRSLAQSVLQRPGVDAVVVGGSPDGVKASLAVALRDESRTEGGAVGFVRALAATFGGGGGGSATLALAGAKDHSRLDDALGEARRLLAPR